MSDRRIGRILVSLGISGALTAWSVVARANEASPPSAATCAHLRLVDGDADARELLGELGDILSADLPFLDVAMASAPDVDRVFRPDGPDAACLTAWVILGASRAQVRVAGAGRCRYVVRDLDLGHPLSPLDRERLAQVTKAALDAVGESREAIDCARSPAVGASPPAPPTLDVRRPAVPPAPLDARREPAAPSSSIAIGASYGGTYHSGAFRTGPGVSFAVSEVAWRYAPEIWTDLRYVLSSSFDDGANSVQAIAGRIGVSAQWWPIVRFGVGGGVDRLETTYEPPVGSGALDVPSTYRTWEAVARAFARFGSRSWNGFSLDATVLLDVVHSSDPYGSVRGGFVVEGWWRS